MLCDSHENEPWHHATEDSHKGLPENKNLHGYEQSAYVAKAIDSCQLKLIKISSLSLDIYMMHNEMQAQVRCMHMYNDILYIYYKFVYMFKDSV